MWSIKLIIVFIGDQLWIIVSNSTYLLTVLHGDIFFSFFKDGMQTINHFNSYITSMIPKLKDLKNRQEGERKQLLELRESLRNSLDSYKEVCFLLRCVYTQCYFVVVFLDTIRQTYGLFDTWIVNPGNSKAMHYEIFTIHSRTLCLSFDHNGV